MVNPRFDPRHWRGLAEQAELDSLRLEAKACNEALHPAERASARDIALLFKARGRRYRQAEQEARANLFVMRLGQEAGRRAGMEAAAFCSDRKE